MELPPGVILASPDEPEALNVPFGQAAMVTPAISPEPLFSPEMPSPQTPSLADFAFMPAEESAPTTEKKTAAAPLDPPPRDVPSFDMASFDISAVNPPSLNTPPNTPKDLPDFFEQHQLEMISTGAQQSGSPAGTPAEAQSVPLEPSPDLTGMLDLSPLPDQSLAPANANMGAVLMGPEALLEPEAMIGAEALSPEFGGSSAGLDALFSDFAISSPDALAAQPSSPPGEPMPLAGSYPLPDMPADTSADIFADISVLDIPGATGLNPDLFAFDSSCPSPGADDALMTAVNHFPEPPQAQPAGVLDQSPSLADAFTPWEAPYDLSPGDLSPSDLSPEEEWMAQGMAQGEAQTSGEASFLMGSDDFLSPPLPDATPPDSPAQEGLTSVLDDLRLGPDALGNLEIPALIFDNPSSTPLEESTLPLPDGLSGGFLDGVLGGLDDEAFDLDRILLGAAESAEAPAQPDGPAEMPSSVSPNNQGESSDVDILDHYFGDEAQGLKGHDNLGSYDFGHYEDPDAPVEAFILDEEPEPANSILRNLSYDQYYVPSDSDLSFSARISAEEEETSSSEEAVLPEVPEAAYTSFLFASEDMDQDTDEDKDEPAEAEDCPEADPPTAQPRLVTDELSEQPAAWQSPPELTAPNNIPVSVAGESITDVINTFSQDILLHNNRFLGRSIDRLVDAYFAQQKQNNA
jgi:hypothetical protein